MTSYLWRGDYGINVAQANVWRSPHDLGNCLMAKDGERTSTRPNSTGTKIRSITVDRNALSLSWPTAWGKNGGDGLPAERMSG
ncbi:hypothetical protein I7I48_01428 [Histoplasma ohiense]|nr:hypothetical protein I7I48_01428 [Histoplasma ohiense (nom. inval.)]